MMIMAGWLGALSIRRSFDKPRQMSTDRCLLSRWLQNVCRSPRKSRTDANTNANSTTMCVSLRHIFMDDLLNEDVCICGIEISGGTRQNWITLRFPACIEIRKIFVCPETIFLLFAVTPLDWVWILIKNMLSLFTMSLSRQDLFFYKNITLLYLYTENYKVKNTPVSLRKVTMIKIREIE